VGSSMRRSRFRASFIQINIEHRTLKIMIRSQLIKKGNARMKPRRKRISKTNPSRMESPLSVAMILDIIGLMLATLVVGLSWLLVPPKGLEMWVCKSMECTGVVAAALAIAGFFKDFFKKKQIKRDQRRVQKCARAQGISETEYITSQIQKAAEPVRRLAEVLQINCTCVKHGNFKLTLDFCHGLLDYIDIFVENFRMRYEARFRSQDIGQVFVLSSRAKNRLVIIGDYNHIGPMKPIRVDDQGIRELQTDLLLAILLPAFLVHGSYVS
jgi:hypothetical protein